MAAGSRSARAVPSEGARGADAAAGRGGLLADYWQRRTQGTEGMVAEGCGAEERPPVVRRDAGLRKDAGAIRVTFGFKYF